jgi:DNA-binding transcriptional LysR family regulator
MMESSADRLYDLRLSDLVTFLSVARTRSVNGAAREMRATPSHVSKALARLEQHYGVKLLIRGPRGMALSQEGREVLPLIEEAVRAVSATANVGHTSELSLELTLAAPSYLVGATIASIASSLPQLRLRGLELAASQIRAMLTEGLFDLALLPGGIRGLLPTWVSDETGALRKVLVGSPAVAASCRSLPLTIDQVRELPFVGALTSMGGRFAPIGDDCPLPASDRKIVHRVQTFGAALELVTRTDCVAFGPWIAASRMLRSGDLVELPVVGWDEREPLVLLCNGDVVRERMRQQILAILGRELTDATSSGTCAAS